MLAARAVRLIPARAGKTVEHGGDLGDAQAHPRAGGENVNRLVGRRAVDGSSPRGRGKPSQRSRALVSRRLIPARAGKTVAALAGVGLTAAHPRAGGENGQRRRQAGNAGGSSPRGRGKRGSAETYKQVGRLIPARAGKTASSCARSRSRAAHPRAGGENCLKHFFSHVPGGSSPRGRGKREDSDGAVSLTRLIPARAGKTFLYPSLPSLPSAHPRAGGENQTPEVRVLQDLGSSPRGRGKQADVLVCAGDNRLIPARAGKTL